MLEIERRVDLVLLRVADARLDDDVGRHQETGGVGGGVDGSLTPAGTRRRHTPYTHAEIAAFVEPLRATAPADR